MLKLIRRGCLLFKNVLGGSVVLCAVLKIALYIHNTVKYCEQWEWISTLISCCVLSASFCFLILSNSMPSYWQIPLVLVLKQEVL